MKLNDFAAAKATILNLAENVMGGRDAAWRWYVTPAIALNGAVPMELMKDAGGFELLTEYLDRLEHGGYS